PRNPVTIATGSLSAKRAHELRVERVERPAKQPLRLAPDCAEVVDDDRASGPVAEHVDPPAPVAERQPEVREHAVQERDPEEPRPPAAIALGPVVAEQDAAEGTH